MKWTAIRDFSHNGVVKVSYVVVICLPLIIEIAEKLGYNFNVPFNVLLLFYSSLILLIAAGLYFIFCPSLIKEYKTVDDYKDRKFSYLAKMDKQHKGSVVYAHLDNTQHNRRIEIETLRRDITNTSNEQLKNAYSEKLDALNEELFPSCLIAWMEKDYHRKNTWTNLLMLVICYVLLALGSAMVLWVFYERFKIVYDKSHLI